MLSVKTTYALQILDILLHHENAMNISDLRNRFPFLPATTFISTLVNKMEVAQLISRPSGGRKYYIKKSLNELTLYDLVAIVDDAVVLGQPVGFRYWPFRYLDNHTNIASLENSLEVAVCDLMKSVTVEELLNKNEVITKPLSPAHLNRREGTTTRQKVKREREKSNNK